ncbi:filamentous hemagglutinin N-terminal domain-containing protein, partial [uncultured Phascolarctobacterium sp.]|uniref:filamentous hemagglutinin N-terminal domain-containing protein n=1 Tax=uncultured Phascolarctobacterium sp. TaxID=512296 RepID=UPI0025D38FF2
MSKYGSKKKKLMACAIILSLQMQTALPVYAAAAAPKAAPPVVNIAAPDANGLSHNKTAEFNVGAEGLVFNNIANGSANTVLAGQLTANANLTNGAAQTILQEVTGGGLSNLHGVMEIAGQRANLIIANPNGINVNGAGFINVDRATLVTGKPDFTGGRLVFNVTGGRVTVEGTGNFPGEGFTSADEANTYLPNKLDIMTRAAVINGELWAKEEINVVTGANKIDYATSERQQLAADGEKPAVALDVAALGGMYAGKIMLVGTEKGLGMNLGGRISAGGDLYISNAGKLTVTENMQPGGGGERENDAAVEAGGSITLLAEELSSSSSIEAKGAVTLDVSGRLENTGSLISGAEYLQDEEADDAVFMHNEADLTLRAGELDNSGLISATKNLTVDIENGMVHSGLLTSEGSVSVTAGGSLTGSGAVGAQESVSVTADKVGLYRGNIYTYTAGTDADGNPTLTFDENKNVSVSEKNPDEIITPVTPEQPQRPHGPERPGNLAGEGAGGAAIAPLPQIAETAGIAATVEQEKAADASLALTADESADGKYRPIIDKAANGVDLVQIAQVNSNGVSRNLYSDFNIKSSGLILNNATKYAKTELGGYVDRNMFLAGRGASVILNEVTSSSASVLNGYLEVAGNRASVVIANANGIAVNGLGFINADNAMLTTGKITGWADGNIQTGKGLGDMLLAGSGFNGQGVGNLQITTHDLTIDRSELYGHEITIDASGSIASSGKLGGDNLRIEAAGDFSGSG